MNSKNCSQTRKGKVTNFLLGAVVGFIASLLTIFQFFRTELRELEYAKKKEPILIEANNLLFELKSVKNPALPQLHNSCIYDLSQEILRIENKEYISNYLLPLEKKIISVKKNCLQ